MKTSVLLPKVFSFPFTYNSNIKTKIGVVIFAIRGLTCEDEPKASSKFDKK